MILEVLVVVVVMVGVVPMIVEGVIVVGAVNYSIRMQTMTKE